MMVLAAEAKQAASAIGSADTMRTGVSNVGATYRDLLAQQRPRKKRPKAPRQRHSLRYIY